MKLLARDDVWKFPERIVSTKYGNVRIVASNADQFKFMNKDGETLSVNGVQLSGSLIVRVDQGMRIPNESLYFRKADRNWKDDYPSNSQLNKIQELAVAEVSRWLAEDPDVIIRARIRDISWNYWNLQSQIERKESEILQLKEDQKKYGEV